MRLRSIILTVTGFSLIVFAMPNFILTAIRHNTDAPARAPVESLEERRVKFFAGRSDQTKVNYQTETKEAIIRELRKKGQRDFEVSQIVFTSEKSKTIAGQRQVSLSFTYQLQYLKGKPEKLKGSLVLASDGAGNWFDSSIKI
jgi:hypothetical protein